MLAAVAGAAAATGLAWSAVAAGTTEPSGAQGPVGYVAVTKAQERRWAPRLEPADRRALAHVDLARRAVVAVFLDGMPCATNVAVTAVRRSGAALAVTVAYTRPPIGVATCIRTSTSYFVLSVPRRPLGGGSHHVTVTAHARS